jgi:hypothetical protein
MFRGYLLSLRPMYPSSTANVPQVTSIPYAIATRTLISKIATSDKARYVPHGVNAGAPDGHCARLPQYAAGVLRCTACVRGRAGQQHWHAYAWFRMSRWPAPPTYQKRSLCGWKTPRRRSVVEPLAGGCRGSPGRGRGVSEGGLLYPNSGGLSASPP